MTAPPLELSRVLPLDRLGSRSLDMEVAAGVAEREAIAKRLGIPAVSGLTCRFSLIRDIGDPTVVLAEAVLSAVAVQVCVVTLEPFEAPVEERFRLRFVPAGRETRDEDPESDDEIGYEGGIIDLGEAAVEQLALALDPFPRRPGASLPEVADEAEQNPFASLGRRPPG